MIETPSYTPHWNWVEWVGSNNVLQCKLGKNLSDKLLGFVNLHHYIFYIFNTPDRITGPSGAMVVPILSLGHLILIPYIDLLCLPTVFLLLHFLCPSVVKKKSHWADI